MRIIVTGGAGFIGSHLADQLLERGHEVKVLDNLSSGKKENLDEDAELVEKDIVKDDLRDTFKDVDCVFHFAANPSVQTFPEDRDADFEQNIVGTKNVLDASADAEVEQFVFASSSVVYGEEAPIPTPEDTPFDPISMYAATKCSCEHICQVYSDRFDIDLTVLRYANIIGPRNQKGVVYDFVQKLRENPEKLTILGNGKQRKSYLHVTDAVEASLEAWKAEGEVFNIGSEDSISVTEIADIVSEEMGLNPDYEYTGGEKGWEGDVPEMRLDISKLTKVYRPESNSGESVEKSVRSICDQLALRESDS